MRPLACVLLFFNLGCSSDPAIMGKYPSVPVVYAIINPYDSSHTVRVHKIFAIHSKTDWTLLPADSLVYREIDATISEKKGEQIRGTETLRKSVIDRDSRFFPAKDYTLYTLDHPFPINLDDRFGGYSLGAPDIDSLILEVQVKDLGLTTRASAPVLDPYRIAIEPGGSIIYLYGMHPTHAYLPGGGEDCDPRNDFCYRMLSPGYWTASTSGLSPPANVSAIIGSKAGMKLNPQSLDTLCKSKSYQVMKFRSFRYGS